jgi:NAD(P)-dependent dehydrogenase (short-subunit alcohol dehydrogenase family)
MAVNVRGVFLGLKAAIPALRARGKGSVVVVSSIAGIKARGTGNAAYVASKHAELGLVKTAAVECGPYGIRVNSVLPGPTDTVMIRELEAARARDTGGSGREAILRGMPLARYGEPEEVARLIAFLASDDSGFCTGGVYTADGGFSAV